MASPPPEHEPTRQLNVRLPQDLAAWAQRYSQSFIQPEHKRFAHQGTTSALVEFLLRREKQRVTRREARARQSEA